MFQNIQDQFKVIIQSIALMSVRRPIRKMTSSTNSSIARKLLALIELIFIIKLNVPDCTLSKDSEDSFH